MRKTSELHFPAAGNVADLLQWWQVNFSRLNLDSIMRSVFEDLPAELHSLASSLLTTSGYYPRTEQVRSDISAEKLIVVETIFADTESDPLALDRLHNAFLRTINSIANQELVGGVKAFHFVYCSTDKELQFVDLAHTMSKLNTLTDSIEFVLIPYSHPESGYNKPSNGHIDAVRLPNKYFAENARRLYSSARQILRERNLDKTKCNIRLAIDDDDMFLPWAFDEIQTISEIALTEHHRRILALGLPRIHVYYPIEGGRVDHVALDVCVTGSKFFVSRDLEQMDHLTPWMLPEMFTANVARSLRTQDVELKTVPASRPTLIYMRSGSSFSSMMKTQHYKTEPLTQRAIGGAGGVMQAAIDLSLNARPSVTSNYQFEIDPPSLSARAELAQDSSILTISGNFHEYISSRDISAENLSIVVNFGTNESRDEISMPFADELKVTVDGWTQRTILRIEDAEGSNLGSAWVRGSEVFLS